MVTTSSNPDSLALVPQRLAHDDEIPASAKRLLKLADQHGWLNETYYSRGVRIGSKEPADHLSVRLWKDGTSLVGLWVAGSWRCGLVGLRGKQSLVTLSSREMTQAVQCDGETQWCDACEKREAVRQAVQS